MTTNERQTAFGVFKPRGHVVVVFATDANAHDAISALLNSGFASHDLRFYTPEQMKQQADDDIAHAGFLATVGQELNLVKAHRDLAEKGCSFLVVRAEGDEATRQVARVARRFNAERAQKYGRFIVEELIPVGDTPKQQVYETPSAGLDAQTRSGIEGDAIPHS
jgi:DICT domain-containing protein